jgi:hypothetical protein
VSTALATSGAVLACYGLAGHIVAGGGAGLLVIGAVMARPRPDPQRWSRGAEGERATAALLERLPARKWVVLHDRRVPGSRANIDHLVVGPTGVWVVDTKALRAEVRAGWRSVRVGDGFLDVEPAAWEAEVVADRLGVVVTPVVAVHGPRVALPRRGRRCRGVRVVPAGALVRRLSKGRRRLRRAQVRALAERAEEFFTPF